MALVMVIVLLRFDHFLTLKVKAVTHILVIRQHAVIKISVIINEEMHSK